MKVIASFIAALLILSLTNSFITKNNDYNNTASRVMHLCDINDDHIGKVIRVAGFNHGIINQTECFPDYYTPAQYLLEEDNCSLRVTGDLSSFVNQTIELRVFVRVYEGFIDCNTYERGIYLEVI